MSKPQLAAEPSMEEILASIRKLISDDQPDPGPTPDPFLSRATAGLTERSSAGANGFSTSAHGAKPAGPAPFNSLADALKVATTLSDQRRSLQHDVISALDRDTSGESKSGFDALPNRGGARLNNVHRLPETSGAQPASDMGGPRLPSFPEWRSGPASSELSVEKRDLLSFDFGTVIPKHEPLVVKSPATAVEARRKAGTADTDEVNGGSGPASAGGSPANGNSLRAGGRAGDVAAAVAVPLADAPGANLAVASAPILVAAESRVFSIPARVPLTVRAEANANGAHADSSRNGAAADASINGTEQGAVTSLAVNGTVAPFPRPLREALKAVEQPVMLQPLSNSDANIVALQAVQPVAKERAADKPAGDAALRGNSDSPLAQSEAETGRNPSGESGSAKADSPATSGAASARADALLDAVVDLVQQQPGALSVFASGSSFISGVGAKKMLEEVSSTAVATSAIGTGAPPKLDRAAAELLRPMLRQWLADNMPRIVEEALRSELTAQTGDAGPSPAKA